MPTNVITRPMLTAAVTLCLCVSPSHAEDGVAAVPSLPPPYPPQLEVTVPYEPTAFASDGAQRLVYELVLRNYESKPLELQQLTILDADAPDAAPIISFDSAQLPGLIRRTGGRTDQPGTMIPNGGSVTVYLMLSFDGAWHVPRHLQHRLRTSVGEISTAAVGTHHDTVQVVGAPVTGTQWLAETGLSNDNGHRRGNMLQNGRSVISRRYAFDWVQVEGGEMFHGDEKSNASYFGYGEALVAVADGVVVSVTDGVPENIPGRQPVIPITLGNTTGNSVVLDIGRGHYAHYMHLKDGSLRVRPGERVTRGQQLGVIGNSGDSFVPHLHFEITGSPAPLAGEGVPYVIESFRVLGEESSAPVTHMREMPMEKMLIDFGS